MLVASSHHHQQQQHHHLVNKSSSLLALIVALGLFQHVFVVNNNANERGQQQQLDQLKAETRGEKLAANNRYFFIDFKMSSTRYWDEIDWYIKESADKLQEILLQEEKEKTMIKTLSSSSENNCNDQNEEGDNKEPAPSPSSSSTGSTAAVAPQSSEAGEMSKKMTFSLSTSDVTSPHLPTATNYQQSIKPVVLENNVKSNGGTQQQENTKVTASRKDSTRNGHEKPFSFSEFSPGAGKKKQARSSSSAPQSKFDELKSWCVSQKVTRPIYTYQQYPGNPQLCVANLRLWNNWQYNGTAQTTKHQAAEMAATNAVSHLQASGVMMPNYGNNIANPSLHPPFAGDRFSSPQQFYHPSRQQYHHQPRGHYLPLHHQQPSNNNEQATTKRQNHAMHDQLRHHPFTGGVPPLPSHMYPCAPQLFHMPSSVPIRAAAIGYDIPVGSVRYPYVDPTYAAYQRGHQPMQPIVFIPPMAPYLPAAAPAQAQFVLTDTPTPPSQVSTHNHHRSTSSRNEQLNSTQQSNSNTHASNYEPS